MAERRWLFTVEGLNDEGAHHVDARGRERDADVEFVGTDANAKREAAHRADLWEERTGDWVLRVTMESRGRVRNG